MAFHKPIKHWSFFVSTLAISTVIAFQNCGGKFEIAELESQILPDDGKKALDTPTPPDEKVNKFVNCSIEDQPATLLSRTCLGKIKSKLNSGTKYENFIEYKPQYPLYSDNAVKRRWLYLPEGKKIDVNDLDNWKFPKGSILYKEFSLNNKLIETRQMEKIGDGNGMANWRLTSFVQLADQSDGIPPGNDFNQLTDADLQNYAAFEFKQNYSVGTPNQCNRCHNSAADVVRGFSYLQLSNASMDFNLSTATQKGILSNVPVKFDEIPGTQQDKEIIGYMQSNCAICHDGGTGGGNGNFRHLSTAVSFQDENLIKRAIASTGLITPGQPDNSRLFIRFSNGTMPPTPHKTIDANFTAALRSWIQNVQIASTSSPAATPVVEQAMIDSFDLMSPAQPVSSAPGYDLNVRWAVRNATTLRVIRPAIAGLPESTASFAVTSTGSTIKNICPELVPLHDGVSYDSYSYILEAANSMGEKVTRSITVSCIKSAPGINFVQTLTSSGLVNGASKENDIIQLSWDIRNASYIQITEENWLDDQMTSRGSSTINAETNFAVGNVNNLSYQIKPGSKYVVFKLRAINAAGIAAHENIASISIGQIRMIERPPAVIWINSANDKTFEIPCRVSGGSSNTTPVVTRNSLNQIISHGTYSHDSKSVYGWWDKGSPFEEEFTIELYDGGGPTAASGTKIDSAKVMVVNGCPKPQRIRRNAAGANECYTP